MILYHAPGGGLGHLVRAAAVKHTLQLPDPVLLCTASSFAPDFAGDFELLMIPQQFSKHVPQFKEWLREQVARLHITEIYLDVFPCGILGEWNTPGMPGVTFHYVGRKIKWPVYKWRDSPFFKTALLTEPLSAAHEKFIREQSEQVQPLALIDAPPLHTGLLPALPCPFWLIVHSAPASEVLQLVEYAIEKKEIEKSQATIVVVSRELLTSLPAGVITADVQPASLLFEKAEQIFSACGFNSMRQTEKFAHKHHFIPFERRYDDQVARAKERKKKYKG